MTQIVTLVGSPEELPRRRPVHGPDTVPAAADSKWDAATAERVYEWMQAKGWETYAQPAGRESAEGC